MSRDLENASRENGLTDEQVLAYLRDNPDFLNRHPGALDALQMPARDLGTGVADLQQAMIERLRGEIGQHADRQQDLLSTTRANLRNQSRIQDCVLVLLAARSFEHLIQTITTDFAVILELDMVALCIETDDRSAEAIRTRGLNVVPSGTIDAIMGDAERVAVRTHIAGDPEIYGPGATLVESDTLLRLTISSATPPALLALGSRDPQHFEQALGAELMDFLSGVVEHVVRIWLHLPE
jgi:uncharacterized protein YigA (DUF484 family)